MIRRLFVLFLLLWACPAWACKMVQGQFAAATATGNQTVDTGTDSVLLAIRFYGSTQTAEGYAQGQLNFHGMATSSTDRAAISWGANDNVTTSVTGKGWTNTKCIQILSSGTPTVDGEADFVSFGTGGSAGQFTINWTNAPASADLIYYEAYYGANLTNASVMQETVTVNSGNESFTGAGFQPDFIFTMTALNTTAASTAAHASVGFGMAASSTEECAITVAAPDADGSGGYNSRVYQSADRTILCYSNAATPAIDNALQFISFDADGFTLNAITTTTANMIFWALCLKGGSYDVGGFDSPTAGGTPQDQSVTTAFRPSGVSFLSGRSTTVDANVSSHVLAFGAGNDSSGTVSEQSVWSNAGSVTNPTQTGMRNVSTQSVTIGIAGNPPTTLAEADYKTQAATSFTVTWTTIDAGAAHKIWYAAFGPGDEPAGGGDNIRRQRLLRGELEEEENEKSPMGFILIMAL